MAKKKMVVDTKKKVVVVDFKKQEMERAEARKTKASWMAYLAKGGK